MAVELEMRTNDIRSLQGMACEVQGTAPEVPLIEMPDKKIEAPITKLEWDEPQLLKVFETVQSLMQAPIQPLPEWTPTQSDSQPVRLPTRFKSSADEQDKQDSSQLVHGPPDLQLVTLVSLYAQGGHL